MVEITAAVVGAVVALLGSVCLSIHARRRDRLDERVAKASGALIEMWLRSQRTAPKLLRGYWSEEIVVLFGCTLRSLHELRVVLGRRARGRRAGLSKTLEHAFDTMRDASLASERSPHSLDARDSFIRSVQIAQAACDRWIASPRSYRKGDLYDDLVRLMSSGD